MKTTQHEWFKVPMTRVLAFVAGLASVAANAANAADPAALSAQELANRLSELLQDGSSQVRLRLEVKDPSGSAKTTFQLQIKSRRTRDGTELVYHVLWPKERKGEAILLRKPAGRAASGAHFTPPDSLRTLGPAQMKEPFFGSDLAYEDLIENFFAWEHQALAGSEVVNRVNCQVLESKPGGGEESLYGRVRTWIDPRRLVPLRIEKYAASGQLVRRIETTRVALDDRRRHIPANLTIHGPRKDSVTELDGSRINHKSTFQDREFSPEALKEFGSGRGE